MLDQIFYLEQRQANVVADETNAFYNKRAFVSPMSSSNSLERPALMFNHCKETIQTLMLKIIEWANKLNKRKVQCTVKMCRRRLDVWIAP